MKNALDAYFTVEAAFVVPMALFAVVMVVYLSFYMYDRCVLEQDCYVLSYRQSIEKGGAQRAGGDAFHAQTGEKLFMLTGLEPGLSEGGTVRVYGNASMDPPLALFDAFREGRWVLSADADARKTDPPKAYRRVRRILNRVPLEASP